MAVSNIEKFDDMVGKMFAQLYLSFPVPHALPAEDFMEAATRPHDTYEIDLPTDDAEFFIATAQWLVKSGFIYGTPRHYTHIEDAVLTAKGLEVLHATPNSLDTGPSLGALMADAAKAGGKETLRSLVTEALSLGVKLVSPIVGITP
jgi:hypothetical protein